MSTGAVVAHKLSTDPGGPDVAATRAAHGGQREAGSCRLRGPGAGTATQDGSVCSDRNKLTTAGEKRRRAARWFRTFAPTRAARQRHDGAILTDCDRACCIAANHRRQIHRRGAGHRGPVAAVELANHARVTNGVDPLDDRPQTPFRLLFRRRTSAGRPCAARALDDGAAFSDSHASVLLPQMAVRRLAVPLASAVQFVPFQRMTLRLCRRRPLRWPMLPRRHIAFQVITVVRRRPLGAVVVKDASGVADGSNIAFADGAHSVWTVLPFAVGSTSKTGWGAQVFGGGGGGH